MKRRLLIIAAAALLIAAALALYVRSGTFHRNLPGLIETQLADALGVETGVVLVKKTRYGVLELSVGLNKKRGWSRIGSANPARVYYELIPPRIQRIEIERAHLNVVRQKDGTLNIDPILNRPAGGGSPPISLGSVHLRELSLNFEDKLDGWIAFLSKVEAALPAEKPLRLDAPRPLSLNSGEWYVKTKAGVLNLDGASLEGELNESGLRIDELRVLGEGFQLRADGVLDPKGNADLKADGTFQLEKLRVFAPDLLEGSSGSVALKNGRITGSLSNLRLEGDWDLSDSVFLGARMEGTGRVSGGVEQAKLDGVRLRLWGGEVDMTVETGAAVSIKGEARRVRLSELAAYFYPEHEALRELEGHASGTFEAAFEEGVLVSSSGTWRVEGMPHMDGAARMTHLVGERKYAVQLSADGLSARLDGQLDESGAVASYRFSASGENLEPMARGFGETASGRFELRAESINGTGEARVWAELNGGSLRGLPMPDSALQGVWRAEPRRFESASLEMRSGAGSFLVKGSASFAESGLPRVDLEAEASEFDLGMYAEALGVLSGRMSARGRLDALDGAGAVQLSGGAVEMDAAAFTLDEGRLRAPALRGKAGGAPWTGAANGKTFAFRLERAAELSEAASLLPMGAREPLRQADGRVHLQIEGADGRIQARLRLDDADAYGVPLGGGNADAVYEAGTLSVKGALDNGQCAFDLTAELKEGAAPFQGEMRFQEMDASALARRYAPGIRSASFTARADLAGDLRRIADSTAKVSVQSARFASDGAVLTAAPFSASFSGESMGLRGFDLRADENSPPFHLQAEARMDEDGSLTACVKAPSIDLQTAAELMDTPAPAEGVGAFALSVSGTADDPVVEASWSADRLALRLRSDGNPLHADSIEGTARCQNGTVSIERAVFSLGGGSASLSGRLPLLLFLKEEPRLEWAADAPIDIRADWNNLDLSALLAPFPGWEAESGALSGTAFLNGTLTEPILTGGAQLRFARLTVPERAPIQDGKGSLQLRLEADELTARNIDLSGSFGSSSVECEGWASVPFRLYPFPSALDLDSAKASLRVESPKLRLSDALALLGEDAPQIKAEAAGAADIQLNGLNLRDSETRADLTRLEAENSGVRLVNDGTVRLRYERGTAYIDKLRLKGEEQTLEASGWVDDSERFDLLAKAENLNLEILSGLTPLETEPLGRLSGSASVRGSLSQPQFDANWSIVEGAYGPIMFDAFTGNALYDGALLSLNGWELTSGVNKLNVDGFAPASLRWSGGKAEARLSEETMRLSLNADSFDISFFPLFLTQLKEASGLGTIDLKIEGPAQKPNLIGSVALENGEIALAYENIRLENVSGRIEAEPETVALRGFQFTADGGTYRLGGQDAPTVMSMEGLTPNQLQMTVKFANARVESWLPKLDIETRLAGHATVSIDVRSLSRQAAEGDWEAAVTQALKSSNGRAVMTDAAIQWGGREASIVEPMSVAFNMGAFRLNKTDIRIGDLFHMTASGVWELDGKVNAPIDGYISAALLQSELNKRLGWAPDMEGRLEFRGSVGGTDADTSGALDLQSVGLRVGGVDIGGSLELAGAVSGNGANHIRSLNVKGVDLRVGGVAIENAKAALEIQNGMLKMTDSGFNAAENIIEMSGEMPLKGGLDFELDADIRRLDILPLIFPSIAQASGEGSFNLSVGGTFEAPRFKWLAQLDGLALNIPDADIDFSEGNLLILTEDGRMRLQRLNGALNGGILQKTDGRESVIDWNGGSPTADVSFEAAGASFHNPTEGVAFKIETADLRAVGPLDSITLKGDANLAAFQYQRGWRELLGDFFAAEDLAYKEALYDYPILRGMTLDVKVQATSRVEIEIERAQFSALIDGRMVGRLARLVFEGAVSNIEGRFSSSDLPGFPLTSDLTLQVQDGFIENRSADLFDPTYNIKASTTETEPLRSVFVTDAQGVKRQRDVDINLVLEGRLSRPSPINITPLVRNTEPGETYALTRTDTLLLLAFGDTQSGARDIAETGLSALAGGFGSMLGLQRLGVEVDADSPYETQFHIAKEFLPRLFINYSSMLQVGQEQRIEFSYEVNDRFSITGERNEEGKYGADLQFSHEF